ncbi:MAG TPA: ABC transporter ATP-binding protein [Bacillota bacterium]|jgi:oligopeptide/dipeptide ABC transporter ATP-binding protein|nr:ATP-binding cassette domain-containing protein [Bacillota bacterium]HOB87830.1 ABC transporter ATP-binding protein [Bacillota bacterium]HOP69484.1 ABC transporter ATP-binding protein [Bacillota bacterium]HPT34410.1 ABC transporter ATP-binding protein [Bacillota bacterium]HPZ64597.1 ABC transporter ATP-binding protein [Bacillota bacterium]
MPAEPLIRVEKLTKHYLNSAGLGPGRGERVKAVDGVSFFIHRGETYGLVGESGCGKSTLGRTMLKLEQPTGGRVFFDGRDIFALEKEALRRLRREMQIILQDPYSSLNPRMTAGEAVGEALEVHGLARGREKRRRTEEMLAICGLPAGIYHRYPHELSAGQCQRVVIARALILNPSFIVADEPIAMLDLSVQAQIVNLLEQLRERFGLTCLFISHDLGMVRHIADRIGVMYRGGLVEEAPQEELFRRTLHPYTRALISAVPSLEPGKPKRRIVLKGEPPDPAESWEGCSFHPRCPLAGERCREEKPLLREVSPGHLVACHLAEGGDKP